MQVLTHLFGSVDGYRTLAKSEGVTEAEDAALGSLGFGSPKSGTEFEVLQHSLCMAGRLLPSGRYAITRLFAGPTDIAGRQTVERRTILLSSAQWLELSHSELAATLQKPTLWNREAFACGDVATMHPHGATDLLPRATELHRRAFDALLAAQQVGRCAALPAEDRWNEAILKLPSLLSENQILGYGWGIGLWAVPTGVWIATLRTEGGHRNIFKAPTAGAWRHKDLVDQLGTDFRAPRVTAQPAPLVTHLPWWRSWKRIAAVTSIVVIAGIASITFYNSRTARPIDARNIKRVIDGSAGTSSGSADAPGSPSQSTSSGGADAPGSPSQSTSSGSADAPGSPSQPAFEGSSGDSRAFGSGEGDPNAPQQSESLNMAAPPATPADAPNSAPMDTPAGVPSMDPASPQTPQPDSSPNSPPNSAPNPPPNIPPVQPGTAPWDDETLALHTTMELGTRLDALIASATPSAMEAVSIGQQLLDQSTETAKAAKILAEQNKPLPRVFNFDTTKTTQPGIAEDLKLHIASDPILPIAVMKQIAVFMTRFKQSCMATRLGELELKIPDALKASPEWTALQSKFAAQKLPQWPRAIPFLNWYAASDTTRKQLPLEAATMQAAGFLSDAIRQTPNASGLVRELDRLAQRQTAQGPIP